MPTSRIRAVLLATAVAALAVLAAPTPAMAAGGTGWVRVAHLSPDTKAVDVRLATLDGTSKVLAIDDVAYGAVSKYWSLPVGRYAVAMRPAGSSESSTPVVSTFVSVAAGGAATVAVFGTNANLTTKVIDDSLTTPKAGDARVRVVQASTSDFPVTVTASSDTTIVKDAPITTVSPYADVKAGRWTLTSTQGPATSSTTVTLEAGQIATVFVLDEASGDIVLRTVLDSSSVGSVPKGYLATGGGFLAHEAEAQQSTAMVAGTAGGAALLLAGAAGLIARNRRRAHA